MSESEEESNWTRTQVGKLWAELGKALIVLWGPNKDDGLMTKVGKLDERQDALETRMSACESKQCLDVASIAAKGTTDAAKWQMWGVLAVQIASIIILLIKLK